MMVNQYSVDHNLKIKIRITDMSKNTKKEHYVPRFYLENFANLSKNQKQFKIYVFDKQNLRSFPSDIKDIATSNYFYDYPADIVGEKYKKVLDEFLDKHEKKVSPFIKKLRSDIYERCETRSEHPKVITRKKKEKVITRKKRDFLSIILAVQILRVPKFRVLLRDLKEHGKEQGIIQDNIQFLLDQDDRVFSKDIEKIIDKLHSEEYMIFVQSLFLVEPEHLATIFSNHIWNIGINNTSIPFYTSDNPVTQIPHLGTGYASEEIEILFPIDSQIILIIRPETHSKSNKKSNGKLVNLEEKDVIEYNKAQIYCSERFIYCQKSTFDLVQQICRTHY